MITLICGEEAYLRTYHKDRVMKEWTEGLNEMNVSRFQGADTSEEAVIDLAETLPFFADYRVILMEDTALFKGSDHPLADYLKEVPDTVRFVFVEERTDKRSRMYKAIAAAGEVIDCSTPSEEALMKWIAQRFQKNGMRVTKEAAQTLLQRTGTDMLRLLTEIDKLSAYAQGKEGVTTDDVDAAGARWLSGEIFAMTDAIAGKDRARALEKYYDLLALKEKPGRIRYLIERQFNLLLQVKEMEDRRVTDGVMAQALSLKPFVLRKYRQWGKGYTPERLRTLLELCTESDEAVKRGQLTDSIGVEMLIVEATKA